MILICARVFCDPKISRKLKGECDCYKAMYACSCFGEITVKNGFLSYQMVLHLEASYKIKLNEESVHLACRFHGHPAFICYIDLNVTLEGEDIIYTL